MYGYDPADPIPPIPDEPDPEDLDLEEGEDFWEEEEDLDGEEVEGNYKETLGFAAELLTTDKYDDIN